jgi:hypothetical protein
LFGVKRGRKTVNIVSAAANLPATK